MYLHICTYMERSNELKSCQNYISDSFLEIINWNRNILFRQYLNYSLSIRLFKKKWWIAFEALPSPNIQANFTPNIVNLCHCRISFHHITPPHTPHHITSQHPTHHAEPHHTPHITTPYTPHNITSQHPTHHTTQRITTHPTHHTIYHNTLNTTPNHISHHISYHTTPYTPHTLIDANVQIMSSFNLALFSCFSVSFSVFISFYVLNLNLILLGTPNLGEIGCDGRDWIDLAQDMDQLRALVNTVMNLRVP
jgi:hypothetical protein